jgi:hypothetical protein
MFNLVQCELFPFVFLIMFILSHDMNNLVFIYVIIFVFGWNKLIIWKVIIVLATLFNFYCVKDHRKLHTCDFIMIKILKKIIR